jgi:hypothetical protein
MTSELILSSIALFITLAIILCYRFNKINAIESYILGFCTQGFYIEYIGPTISTLLLLTMYLAFEDIFLIIKNQFRFRIKLSNLLLISLPIASFLLCYSYFIFNDDIFQNKLDASYAMYFIKYYLKNYLIFFAIGWRVSRDLHKYDIARFFVFLERMAIASCLIAILQLFFHAIFGYNSPVIPTSHGDKGYLLDLIVGLKSYSYTFNNIPLTRPNAFFFEPKELAGFIALIIPYILYKKKYIKALFALFVGVLTSSSTFYIVLLIATINFALLNRIKYLRTIVLMNIFILIAFAFIITNSAEQLLDKYGTYSDKLIYKLLLERSVTRLDTSMGMVLQDKRKDFFGIPLQRDLELPVVNFMRDNPIVFLLGYGPGNARSVPNDYFLGTPSYEQRVEGKHLGHMNMGWLYYVSEMGIFCFIIYFVFLTKLNINGNSLKYYAFIVSSLFVYRVDVLLVIIYVILSDKKCTLNTSFAVGNAKALSIPINS